MKINFFFLLFSLLQQKKKRNKTKNSTTTSVRSPFLTRGSVAERVLIFEKCPDVRNSFLNIKRPDRADAPPRSLLKVST